MTTAALSMIVGKHEKTGKTHIDVAEITFQFMGHKVQVYMAHHIQVDIDDIKQPTIFKRDASLLQILYYIEELLCEN